MPHVSIRTTGSLAIVLAVLLSVVLIAQQSQHELFERARLLEDSNQDLAEAISLYGQVVDQANGERALAAAAQLRVGLIHERLGHSTDARRAFEAVVREYADQAESADHAGARLAALTELEQAASANDPVAVVTRQVWTGREADGYGAPSPDSRYLSAVGFDTGDLVLRDLVSGDTRRLTNNEFAWEAFCSVLGHLA